MAVTARPALHAIALVAAVAGCSAHRENGLAADGKSQTVASSAPRPLAADTGFRAPEAIVYDSALDAYFVSNVNGTPGVRDGNGFISKLSGDGHVEALRFIAGGRRSVTLDGPMGSRIHGDTLWVLDIDVLRAFDAATGRRLGTIDFAPLHAKFLNDFDFGPHGDIYVTDMGITAGPGGKLSHTGPDRIYRVGRNHVPVVALETPALHQPDGIAWDARARRFIITPFDGSHHVLAWRPGERAPVSIATGAGRFDGVEVEHDGRILLTAWSSHSVMELRGDSLVTLVGGLTSPSDVTEDVRRGQIGISQMQPDSVSIWALARAPRTATTSRGAPSAGARP